MNRGDHSSKWGGCWASHCSLTMCSNICKCETTGHFHGDLRTIFSSECGDKKTGIFTVCGDQSMMVLSPKPNQSQNTTYKRSAETYNANIHFRFGLRVRVKQTELLTQWRHRVITNHQGETTIVQNFVANQSLFVEFDLKKITSPSWWIRLRICPLWELNGHTFSTGWDFSVWTKFVGWLTDGHWHRCQLYFCPHLSLIVETFYDFIWFSFFFQGLTQHSLSSSQKLL